MTLDYQFPKDFWWGSAASATQTEGSTNGISGATIWDRWYKEAPNRFFEGVGPDQTSDFYHRYKEDITNMKAIGHNSFRLSISWARLIPGGKGDVNDDAVRFYNEVIDELLNQGIEPFVNLYHFDMPIELQDIGGWENREVIEAYADYAKIAFDLFGDRVKTWFTFNEPIVPVEGGYLYDFHYPNVVDARRAIQVAYNTMIAHARAVKLYHEAQDGKIGIVLNLTPSYPRSQNPADLKAAHICDLFFNRSFLDPAVLGEYPDDLIELLEEHGQLPETKVDDKDLLKNNIIDILGVNYYQPRRVKAKEHLPNPYAPFMPDWFFDNYEMPGRKMNVYRGWEIYEKGIYDIMINLKENYGNIDSFISENGMGVQNEERFIKDGRIEDDYRIDFIKEHLKWLHKAAEEGCNVKGYHLWTFMDNWSWMNAYKNRYGFFSVDLETGERTAKKSAEWIAEVSKQNGFND
ncbi:6-phospho-beta-glucosidase [Alkalibacterium putridalgicola]|uniref:6-phospho-beta-glucosidase n=1 Tax=Alkalibacterium putridalgicola TaxID=426703 RepID=A0A1H7STZ1_9LACT|nr:glycoside hydrolase family 1 protein [Alkalibacterium putridalgicola]GEK89147.1 6-phospho-beta-glucosidase GmuD [Alkalibacterium putridalgicola]SEL75566.1 6-phospho-beta-glucosidase [Alkalibacterium putridalgicola]